MCDFHQSKNKISQIKVTASFSFLVVHVKSTYSSVTSNLAKPHAKTRVAPKQHSLRTYRNRYNPYRLHRAAPVAVDASYRSAETDSFVEKITMFEVVLLRTENLKLASVVTRLFGGISFVLVLFARDLLIAM